MNHATSTNCIFSVEDFTQLKNKVLNWTNRFSTFCFLDNHGYNASNQSVECTLAAGTRRFLQATSGEALYRLQEFINRDDGWLFGHIGYDLKNEIEQVYSLQKDRVQFPDLLFFEPEVLIRFDQRSMMIHSETGNEDVIFHQICGSKNPTAPPPRPVAIQSRLTRDGYITIIQDLQKHIARGDCYEVNFCQEFFAQDATIDPLSVYKSLSQISPNPFSAFYKIGGDKYLMCASPERFLQKKGSKILSQPIKGTSKRMADKPSDEQNKRELVNSSKERSENVMIVDLVRNDLSKVCREGTVKVDEFCQLYSFPQVHQMISTISGTLKPGASFAEIIRATFPMGSMTGAPKKRVLELIAQYEEAKRGIFSGALGYIEPGGDFDFNVVIRSIMYNATLKNLSFQVGSGITIYSHPEKEWEECLWKAEAMKRVLAGEPVGI